MMGEPRKPDKLEKERGSSEDADSLNSFKISRSSREPPTRESSSSSGVEVKKKKKKAILTPVMALEIYSYRNVDTENKTAESCEVANKYGISSKSVRDIWDRRTWARITRQMWTRQEKEDYDKTHQRGPGRPSGTKDSKPRKRRIQSKRQSKVKAAQLASTSQEAADVFNSSKSRKRRKVKKTEEERESPRPASDKSGGNGSSDNNKESTDLGQNSEERTSNSSPYMSCSSDDKQGSPQWVAAPTAEGIQDYMQSRHSSEES
uniref:Uncharacterized protein n=1 Tax=Guillardia theta TaxID=55529 RepID=A0A6U6C969_GUITH|mmetsp:Transcript_45155/g.142177  ORF Transcript_45155/g.142177 Transcript_45155/m.142177 type:complete len:262 (+) Transcript_45155:265-1050(+)